MHYFSLVDSNRNKIRRYLKVSPSRTNLSPTIMLCLLVSTLIIFCDAGNNNTSGNTIPNKGTQRFPPHGPCSGYGACLCAPGIPGVPGNPGSSGPAGIAGSTGPQGSTGQRGDRGEEGKPGTEGPPGPKGPEGNTGPAGPRGAKGDAGDKGRQGPQGTTGKVGPRGTKGNTGTTGSQGPPGPMGPPGTLGGNWKQCVFQNLNEGKDSGLIKDCVFKKKAGNTALRVFWSGPLRIYNCHSCCRRWYFTFNGAECSAPAAIDGVVYMIHGNGPMKDLHRVRQIEGVCEKVQNGTVRVGFWVGNCAGMGSADAYTGWNSVSRIYVEEIPPPQA